MWIDDADSRTVLVNTHWESARLNKQTLDIASHSRVTFFATSAPAVSAPLLSSPRRSPRNAREFRAPRAHVRRSTIGAARASRTLPASTYRLVPGALTSIAFTRTSRTTWELSEQQEREIAAVCAVSAPERVSRARDVTRAPLVLSQTPGDFWQSESITNSELSFARPHTPAGNGNPASSSRPVLLRDRDLVPVVSSRPDAVRLHRLRCIEALPQGVHR